MLEILQRIGTPELLEHFVRDVLPKDFDGSEGKTLLRLCEKFGWGLHGAALRKLIEQQKPTDYFARIQPIVALFRPLCCDSPPLSDERRAVCAELADALIEAIERWDKKATTGYGSEDSRAGIVDGVIHAFASISATKQLDRFLTHVLADQRNYDLHQVLIPDVKAIYQWLAKVPEASAAATRLLEHCRSELRAATAHTIEPPADWAREAKLGCKCEDCQALSRFLRDPQARVGRFPIRKERRQHLHQQIDKLHCDCTHVTERKGSPQTLVCTKTQASYERRRQQYKVDVMLLDEMDTLAKANEKSSRQSSAVKRRVKR
jgi:hypothetical protein